jgi:hypothetical protein
MPPALALLAPALLLLPGPLPLGPAGRCALVDTYVGEDLVLGLQCGSVRFFSASHLCIVEDPGIRCRVAWTVWADAWRWAGPGDVSARLTGWCDDAQDGSWGPGGAAVRFRVETTCTTPEFFVPRGTCTIVPARIEAVYGGLLPAPAQVLEYGSGVCDRRDPLP